MIYLDHCANTPADPAVLESFCKTERSYIENAGVAPLTGISLGKRWFDTQPYGSTVLKPRSPHILKLSA